MWRNSYVRVVELHDAAKMGVAQRRWDESFGVKEGSNLGFGFSEVWMFWRFGAGKLGNAVPNVLHFRCIGDRCV